MSLDFTWLSKGNPIFAFVLVFVIAYAVIVKTKILGDNKSINAVTSIILSIIFLSFTSVRNYLIKITPWFGVVLTVAFFFFMIVAFMIKEDGLAKFTKPLTIIFIILFALILIITIFYTFESTQAYIPGESETGANDFLLSIKHFIFERETLSGILLLVIAIVVGFIITR